MARNDKTPWRDEDILRELYWGRGMSTTEIGEELGCEHMTVYDWMKRHKIPRRSVGGSPKYPELASKEVLEEMYIVERMTQNEIANEVGCSGSAVAYWLRQHEIETRTETTIPEFQTPDYLKEQYLSQGKTAAEIADQVDCCLGAVYDNLRRHEIEIRSSNRYHASSPPRYFMRDDGYMMWKISTGEGNQVDVLVHRLLAVAEYEMDIGGDDVVHHKNDIKWDNRPSNIEVMERGEHSAHHVNSQNVSRDDNGKFVQKSES